MRKILVASSNGGCGKTTVSVNLAASLAHRGQRVALLDADPQGSARSWAGMRPPDLPAVPVHRASRQMLQALAPDHDVVIIDTAAGTRAGQLAQRWLDVVDAVLVPVLPSGIDLDASLPFLLELSRVPRIARGRLPVGVVANRLRAWTRTGQDALAEMDDDFPFRVIARLRDNQAYVLLAGLGKSLFDYHAQAIREQQADWRPLQRWLQRQAHS